MVQVPNAKKYGSGSPVFGLLHALGYMRFAPLLPARPGWTWKHASLALGIRVVQYGYECFTLFDQYREPLPLNRLRAAPAERHGADRGLLIARLIGVLSV